MKIKKFRIENFRNIRLAECEDPPDFMVICGGNGCGKSALLEALMTAKEAAGGYGGFTPDPRAISADAEKASISITLEFSDTDRKFVKEREWRQECPKEDEITVELIKGKEARATKRSPARQLLSWYSRQSENSPGFFDFIDAYRFAPKKRVSEWNPALVGDNSTKETLAARGSRKFQFTKDYLVSLRMRDLQEIDASQRAGTLRIPDSFERIRDFFNKFFAPMTFKEVRIDESPFQYIIGTPRGDIDIDDLSGGEKEVLNIFVRFHQLNPQGAVILFDEPDAHLHPDLERRYLKVLREIGEGNQIWITTHSPAMMIEAGHESLFTLLKDPPEPGGNQLVRVSKTEERHEVLAEIMGSRGMVSFNQRVIFIEGTSTSTDCQVYERFYPPNAHNVSFVPAGESNTVRKTMERVNRLLSASPGFQFYYGIVDKDVGQAVPAPSENGTLFTLPVYHVENLLLDNKAILEATRKVLDSECPYSTPKEVEEALKEIVLEEAHVQAFADAVHDARRAQVWKEARDAWYNNQAEKNEYPPVLKREDALLEAKATLQQAVQNGSWRTECKGRKVLRAYCGRHKLKYKHFRNYLIRELKEPPKALKDIMDKILGCSGDTAPSTQDT